MLLKLNLRGHLEMIKLIYNWFKGKLPNKNHLPNKDPKDLTKSASSTDWEIDYFCPKCKNSVSLKICLAHICPHCGSQYKLSTYFSTRSKRQIYVDGSWLWQLQYADGTTEVINNEQHKN